MSAPRIPLSRDRVLRAAIAIADADGVGALTMRRLARELDAEAMSLYHHVTNKDDVLDGVVDVIAGEINAAVEHITAPTWKAAARERILTARSIFLRHPWAPAVFAGRTTVSFEVVRYHDRLVGLMHDGGFTYDLAHHALHALGSRALGFAQELFDPGDAGGAAEVPPEMAAAVPNLVGMLAEVAHDDPGSTLGWCDDQFEFEFGLDLVLDGLERLRTA
ncbi:TetR/AcrR family transcriptional regulator C-terminal domain-containing protein [Cryptosporangium arvum]|uniref:TetR/AcrR family transcriptional regulator C-terminal domain-containing protein n=1 Tax=Cryptosporangium arvum TaxID=80871 RepID=UPI0004B1FCC7|nr:TetR/AcrR family transcriptional regulator C-terminal domain-containing protein [Cryptosporangium arvum]